MKRTGGFIMILTMVGIAVSQPSLGGQAEYKIPDGGKTMLPENPLRAMQSYLPDKTVASVEMVETGGMPFADTVRVTVHKVPENSWEVSLTLDTVLGLEKGEVALLSLYLRVLESDEESGEGAVLVKTQQNAPPWNSINTTMVRAGKEWRQTVRPFTTWKGLPTGECRIAIDIGSRRQTVEIGGLQLLNYGTSMDMRKLPQTRVTYEGRQPGAAWRAPALERIEKHRKDGLAIRVVDSESNPVPDTKVDVKMVRHTFGFGSVVQPNLHAEDGEDAERYRELMEKYFNKTTLESGLRWQTWFRGREFLPKLDWTLDWLKERNIEARGHYLMLARLSPGTQPPELLDDPEGLRRAYFAHLEEKTRWVGDRVGEWDAVNHIVGGTKSYSDLFGKDIYAEVIRRGRELAPHAEMWVNEGQVLAGRLRREPYRKIIQFLVDSGAPPDGIGFMAHFRDSAIQGLIPVREIYRVLEGFAEFGLKLQLTEFDVECGNDEQLQADYLRDVMTVAFSHPSVEGVVMWGFWEGRHWRPPAALWRKDWSIKPAGEVWLDLVFNQWWTDETGETDENGKFEVRGFHGKYRIEARKGEQSAELSVTLPKGGTECLLVLE